MPKTPKPGKDEELERQADHADQEEDDLELVGGAAEVMAPEEEQERQGRGDRRQADARQLELDHQHEEADEQEQPAHVGIGQDRDQRVDPGRAVDADRLAAQAVEALELLLVADDLAQPEGGGLVAGERSDADPAPCGPAMPWNRPGRPRPPRGAAAARRRSAGRGPRRSRRRDRPWPGRRPRDGPSCSARNAAFLVRTWTWASLRSWSWPFRPVMIWRTSPIRAAFLKTMSRQARGKRAATPRARSSM